MRAELLEDAAVRPLGHQVKVELAEERREAVGILDVPRRLAEARAQPIGEGLLPLRDGAGGKALVVQAAQLGHRSEEHTSELQSLMRISYAVFCLKKKTQNKNTKHNHRQYTRTR